MNRAKIACGALLFAVSCGSSTKDYAPPWDTQPGCESVTGAKTFAVDALLPLDVSGRARVSAELCDGTTCARVELDSHVVASTTPARTVTSPWSTTVAAQSAYLVADRAEARWRLHFGVDGTRYPAGDSWRLRVVSLSSGRVLVDATGPVPEYADDTFPCSVNPGSLAELDAGPASPDICAEPVESMAPEAPVLHYAFEGDNRNSGTLGANHDGLLHEMSYVAGEVGLGLAPKNNGGGYFDVSLADFASTGGFTLGFWFLVGGGTSSELFTGLGMLVRAASIGSVGAGSVVLYRGSAANSGGHDASAVDFDFAPLLWHQLALRSTSLNGPVDVLVDGSLVGTLPNTEQIPLWLDEHESLTLGVGPILTVDELVLFDHALDDAAVCTDALGGHWCADTVCGLP